MFKFDLQLFGGGGKGESSTTSSYEMSDQQKALANYAVNNADIANPQIQSYLNTGSSLANNNIALLNQSDAAGDINATAQNQIASANSNLSNLGNGQLTDAQIQNMTNAVSSAANSAIGNVINGYANKGVLNSSVTNQALNDVEKNVTDSLAENYNNTLSTLTNTNNSAISNADAGQSALQNAMTTAYTPVSNAYGLASNLNSGFISSPLSAMSGTGTTTQTSDSGGFGLGSILGLGASAFGGGYLSKLGSLAAK